MWKPLSYGHRVCVGDKIRYTNQALSDHLKVYKVEHTEQYYFVVSPEAAPPVQPRVPEKKVIRHFDVEHYIRLELWIDAPHTAMA